MAKRIIEIELGSSASHEELVEIGFEADLFRVVEATGSIELQTEEGGPYYPVTAGTYPRFSNGCGKDGQPITTRQIRYSCPAGFGTVRILCTGDGGDADFSGASASQGAGNEVLAHYYNSGRYGGSLGVRLVGSENPNVLTAAVTGSANYYSHHPGVAAIRRWGGIALDVPASATAFDNVRLYDNGQSLLQIDPILQTIPGVSLTERDWGMYMEEDMVAEWVATSGGSVSAMFGMGYYWHTGLLYQRCFVGMLLAAQTRNCFSPVIRDPANIQVPTSAYPFTGYDARDQHCYRMEWGVKSGVRFLHFLVDGIQVVDVPVPLSAAFEDASMPKYTPYWGAYKEDATSTDSITLHVLTGEGCKIGTYTP